MKDEQKLYDAIDAYLKGDFSEAIPPKGISEEEWLQEIVDQQSVREVVLLHRLAQVSETVYQVDRKAQLYQKMWQYALFIIILGALITLGYFFWPQQGQATNPRAFSRRITPPTEEAKKRLAKPSQTEEINSIRQQKESDVKPDLVQKENLRFKTEKIPETPQQVVISTNTTTILETAPLSQQMAPSILAQEVSTPCTGIRLKAQYTFQHPCLGQANGQIDLEESSGGQAPYSFSVDGGLHFQTNPRFLDLAKGTFVLTIQDARHCVSGTIASVVLAETRCDSEKSTSYVFNPTKETWELPSQKELSGNIEIYSSKGALVYKANFNKFETLNWNGLSLQGDAAGPGVYVYRIRYDDATQEQGSVTIVY